MVFFINEQYLGLVGDNMSLEKKIKEKDERIEKLEELLEECNLLLIKQQANDEVEHKESVELVLRIDEVLK